MSTRPAAELSPATQRAATTGWALAAEAARVPLASEEEVLDDDQGCSLLLLVGLAVFVVSVWLVVSTVLLAATGVAITAVVPPTTRAEALLLVAKSSVGRARTGMMTVGGSPAGALSI